jgi:hypothetical protein
MVGVLKDSEVSYPFLRVLMPTYAFITSQNTKLICRVTTDSSADFTANISHDNVFLLYTLLQITFAAFTCFSKSVSVECVKASTKCRHCYCYTTSSLDRHDGGADDKENVILCRDIQSEFHGIISAGSLQYVSASTRQYDFSCSSPLYPKQGEQPRLWFIVVGSRSLDGQGTQAYSVLL